jgi:CRISPR/Cas system-associated endoribonuclease Cas2
MEDRLRRLIDPREDSVRFYFLCRGCVSRIQVMGIGEVTRISSFYWI